MKAVIFAALLGACSWTQFDDLEGEAWVHSTGKPDNNSANWGVAVQRINRSGSDGGRLAVLGANDSIYAEVQCGPTGDTTTANALELNTQFGIGNLATDPILLADPATDEIALVTKSGSASIAVLRGSGGQLTVHQVFGPERPDAATYMVPPLAAQPTLPGQSQTLVAQDDTVFGTFFQNPPNPQPKCKLAATATPVQARALGAFRPAGQMFDDVIVWGGDGKLYRFPGGVFNGATQAATGCAGGTNTEQPIGTALDTTFKPVSGSQVLTFEQKDGSGAVTGRFAVLQGHDDAGKGHLSLVNLDTMMFVGSPRTDDKLKIATLLEPPTPSDKRYVIAGYPTAVLDGVTSGQVQVFEVNATSGIGSAPAMTLHDAQPEENQSFGRGVAVMSYNGKPVIAVGADNDVYVYYRTNLYSETRRGR